MTHEFRTPVNAIIGLCKLMLDDRREEGREPEPELGYILRAADQLSGARERPPGSRESGSRARPSCSRWTSKSSSSSAPCAACCGRCCSISRWPSSSTTPRRPPSPAHRRSQGLADPAQPDFQRAQVHRAWEKCASRSAMDEPAGTITFTWSDTGIGIAPEDQEAIFEEFSQLEHRLQRRVRGTGTGTAAGAPARGTARRHAAVTSEPGVGSTFSVSLPGKVRRRGKTRGAGRVDRRAGEAAARSWSKTRPTTATSTRRF